MAKIGIQRLMYCGMISAGAVLALYGILDYIPKIPETEMDEQQSVSFTEAAYSANLTNLTFITTVPGTHEEYQIKFKIIYIFTAFLITTFEAITSAAAFDGSMGYITELHPEDKTMWLVRVAHIHYEIANSSVGGALWDSGIAQWVEHYGIVG